MRFLLFIPLIISSIFAETYEEYLRSQEKAFSSFKEARDKEFSEFLNKEWKAYKEAQGTLGYEEKKPQALPKAPVAIIKQTRPKEIKQKVVIVEVPSIKAKPKVYKKIIIPPSSEKLKTLYIKYFGVDLEIHYDKSVLISMQKNISQEDISSVWNALASSEYESTISELDTISKKLQLNGWAQYILVKQVSNALFKNENEAKIFSWFTLLKLGYDAHISYQRHTIVLLLPIKGDLFNTIYYTLKGKKYYAIDYYARGKIGSVLTYDNVYEGASKNIDFDIA